MAGLYGAVIVGFFAALFGVTKVIPVDNCFDTRRVALDHAARIVAARGEAPAS